MKARKPAVECRAFGVKPGAGVEVPMPKRLRRKPKAARSVEELSAELDQIEADAAEQEIKLLGRRAIVAT
jgi:antitoxin component of MazEF toxin-antitoxin module